MPSRSYKASGINLKAMAMGESDRLVTVLTKENGLVRAIAPGARKHKSKLAGRSGLFVVNDLLFTKGKSLDKLIQAETQQSFPGLSKDLAKLTASQYLAEIALAQALTDQPQEELYYLLIEHLTRLEAATKPNILPCLAQATFHLLALAGVAPEVFRCCLSRSPLTPDLSDPDWRVGFSISSGGAVAIAEIKRMEQERLAIIEKRERDRLERAGQLINTAPLVADTTSAKAAESPAQYAETNRLASGSAQNLKTASSGRLWMGRFKAKVTQEVIKDLGIVGYLTAAELALMQQLSKPELVMTAELARSTAEIPMTREQSGARIGSASNRQIAPHISSKSGTMKQTQYLTDSVRPQALEGSGPHILWRHIETFLRQYAQYQFDRPIRSATLIETCFHPPSHAPGV